MNIAPILGIIAQIPKLVETVVDLVDDTKSVLSEDDAKQLEEALATLQTQNDAAYTRVRAKLAEAASK